MRICLEVIVLVGKTTQAKGLCYSCQLIFQVFMQIGLQIGSQSFDHRVLANLIKRNPQFTGQPINLLSCNTGVLENGFAKNLANKLGVEVQAPNNFIWAWNDGKLGIHPMGSNGGPVTNKVGEMVPFKTGK